MPAPESTHAVRGAIDEALRCKAEGKSETILFCLSGHGHFDMASYTNYLAGKLTDQPYDEKELAMAPYFRFEYDGKCRTPGLARPAS